MIVHKVSLNEFEEIDYFVIAIHTQLEGYRLAYFVNLALQINLSKSPKDILVNSKEGKSFFLKYSYYDDKKDIAWHLIQNKNEIDQDNRTNYSLFFNHDIVVPTQIYLIPEHKKTDFFLKIEACQTNFNIAKTIADLNSVKAINMAYGVKTETIKSKNNLIF